MNFTAGKGFPVVTQNLQIQSVKKKTRTRIAIPSGKQWEILSKAAQVHCQMLKRQIKHK